MYFRPETSTIEPKPDRRIRDLLGPDAWRRLAPAIRERFGKRVEGGASVAYQGEVTVLRMNWAGWLLAQATRLIGAPLPYDSGCVGKPAVVVVTEDAVGNGQFWIRQYGRKSGFPQMVHSSKRFSGPTGLEEYIGYGIGMALRLEAQRTALLFKSDHYFLSILGRRVRLPRIVSPGALVIGHHDQGNGAFRFSLELKNRIFGTLLVQDAVFQEVKP
ncbi:MAG: DUF4166 domain-containing protein [Pseudomonadota bacterium]